MKILEAFMRVGKEVAFHDMEKKYMRQAPKTPSLLSIMLHTEEGQRHARESALDTDVLEWVRLFYSTAMATPAVYEIMQESEEGYMFRCIFTVIFTNLIISKEERDESSLLIKPDSAIRPTILHSLKHHFCNIWEPARELKQLPECPRKASFDSIKCLLS